eukprot:3592177-Alexandrium_andersonii.AAC.1
MGGPAAELQWILMVCPDCRPWRCTLMVGLEGGPRNWPQRWVLLADPDAEPQPWVLMVCPDDGP